MDEPSVQLYLDLKHAVQNGLATCRPLLHRLHRSTYLVQIPRPAHAIRHGSRFYFNILVDCGFSYSRDKSRDWYSSSHPPRQTETSTISAAEELLSDVELLASGTGSGEGRKNYDAVEYVLSRLETLVDVAVMRSYSVFDEAFLRQINANVPVFAPQEAVDQILELQHFRTVVPLTSFGQDGYKDWRDTTLPPLPEWVGLSVLPKAGDELQRDSTLLVAFNNHHHNATRLSTLTESEGRSGARQKRHAPSNDSEESAEAIFFTRSGLANDDSQLLPSADPPLYPLVVLQGMQERNASLGGEKDEGNDEEDEASWTQKYKAKYYVYERDSTPDKGHGFLAWLIAKARLPFTGGPQEGVVEASAMISSTGSKKQDLEQIELINEGSSTTSALTVVLKSKPADMVFTGLLFCNTCGNLLPRASKDQAPHITCELCETVNPNEWPSQSTTKSLATAFPSALQRKRDTFSTLAISQEIAASQQVINEECPRCHNPQLQFREVQLRSADEGTTIFYTCPKCSHKFNTNN
ncbi:hypothetical protein Q7P37_003996 [Cladosporium fusiforme]